MVFGSELLSATRFRASLIIQALEDRIRGILGAAGVVQVVLIRRQPESRMLVED